MFAKSYTSAASRVYHRPAVLICDGLLILASFACAFKASSIHGPIGLIWIALFACGMAGLIPAHISDVLSEGHVPNGDYDRYADVGVILFTIVWLVTLVVAMVSFFHGFRPVWAWGTIGAALFFSTWIEMTRGLIEP